MTVSWAPAPGAAPAGARVRAQARLELALLARNGEQLVLTLVIPTGLLVLFATVHVVALPAGPRVAFLAPGVLALAVISTAFTSLAIGTGFDRRAGALRRAQTTPLTRGDLLAAKVAAVAAVEAGQVVLISLVAVALGWRPPVAGMPAALLLLVLGSATFTALGLLLAGTLRAEATLAVANLVFVVLLLGSGIVLPLTSFPAPLAHVARALPSTALADGLRVALTGHGLHVAALGVLVVWGVAAAVATMRTFRWS